MYAITDEPVTTEFRERWVQESKHYVPCESRFAKLKNMRRISRLFGAVLFLAGAGTGTNSAVVPRLAESQAGKSVPKTEDNSLGHEIHHQLQVLPYYSVFDYISFSLEGGNVTLTGFVVRPSLRRDAEAAIRSIEGVSSVSNLIQVLPQIPADDDLRNALYRAIFEDSTLQRYAVSEVPAIHIIVKEGSVTLEGAVDSESDKKLAEVRAASVPGSKRVGNSLVVRTKAAPAN